MYLRHIKSGNLVEVTEFTALIDPCLAEVRGCIHAGEELQDAMLFAKKDLEFPSGEALPTCWLDSGYRARQKIA